MPTSIMNISLSFCRRNDFSFLMVFVAELDALKLKASDSYLFVHAAVCLNLCLKLFKIANYDLLFKSCFSTVI
jgi:hypothetical protein